MTVLVFTAGCNADNPAPEPCRAGLIVIALQDVFALQCQACRLHRQCARQESSWLSMRFVLTS
jgi:hypothetical protein